MRMSAVKTLFKDEQMHLEPRHGTREAARDYCMKEDTRIPDTEPQIYGYFDSQQGKRRDIEDAVDVITRDPTLSLALQTAPSYLLRYPRGAMLLRSLTLQRQASQWRTLSVSVVWGPTGSGKTRSVFEKEENLYVLPVPSSSQIWFDGYTGQPAILIDDFYGWIKPGFLLRILDGYPLLLPVKGDHVPALYERVYITSNEPPDSWYSAISPRVLAALNRRIHSITFLDLIDQ
jgi:hypothetical protein